MLRTLQEGLGACFTQSDFCTSCQVRLQDLSVRRSRWSPWFLSTQGKEYRERSRSHGGRTAKNRQLHKHHVLI